MKSNLPQNIPKDKQFFTTQNLRKDNHHEELNYIKNQFKDKLHNLQKQLIIKKQYVHLNLYNNMEDVSSRGLIQAHNKKNNSKSSAILAYAEKQSEFDDQIEKVMKKHSSRYDIKEMLPLQSPVALNKHRKKVLGDILDQMLSHLYQVESNSLASYQKNIKEEPDYFEESVNQQVSSRSVRNSLQSDENQKENRQKARMLEYMFDSMYNAPDEYLPLSEKVATQADRIISTPKAVVQKQNVYERDFNDNLAMQGQKKMKIQNDVTGHLYKMGISPKRDKRINNVFRDSRGRTKLPVVMAKEEMIQEELNAIELLKRKNFQNKRFTNNSELQIKQQLQNLEQFRIQREQKSQKQQEYHQSIQRVRRANQKTPLPAHSIISLDTRMQDKTTYESMRGIDAVQDTNPDVDNIQSVLSRCDKMHSNLNKMSRNFISKQKKTNKNYSTMNFKLESIKFSSFFDRQLMLIDQ